VEFTAIINMKRCSDTSQQITISPVGIDQNLQINLKTICKCPCEDPNANAGYAPNAELCNYVGANACGVCNCNPGHTGLNCECNSNAIPDSSDPK
jgi:hypothetical protein